MPKKRAPKYDTKPSSPAHPSLSSSKPRNASHSLTSSGTPSGNSVNDQIQKLRLSERAPPSLTGPRAFLDPGSNPSLPPALRDILQLPDAPAPRPRPGLRVTGARRVPGPAAPQSWLRGNQERGKRKQHKSSVLGNGAPIQVESLPGAKLPHHGSLLATTLKALAKNWDWHKVYDQYYLATIPVGYKEALLHYVAAYGEHGIDKAGLELLFQDEHELEGATGAEGLTHLDLTTSMGYPLKSSDLKALLSTQQYATCHPADDPDSPPESWESTPFFTHNPSTASPFSNLTHLSLAHPQPTTSAPWKGLLSLAPSLSPTLTHISLAYWPPPTLTPNSTTAYRSTPTGNVPSSATHFYSALDQDWSEAASILRRLSKATYCLQWLDLTGCKAWVKALGRPELDWVGSWGTLETVKVGQASDMPACFSGDGEGAFRQGLRRLVHNPGLGWRELHEWADAEKETIEVEKDINTRITYLGWTHGLSEEGVTRPDLLHQQVRTTRVRFDRGWDAWWIKEAVEELSGVLEGPYGRRP